MSTSTVLPPTPPVYIRPALALAATQSSHRWAEPPGNFDRLNCRTLWHSSNEWGIPDLPHADLIPTGLVAYSDRHACTNAPPGAAVHFFLDDYRFETVWSKPERGQISEYRLAKEVELLANRRHESWGDSGKFAIDRAVQAAAKAVLDRAMRRK